MEHSEAVKQMTAERYLLDELTPEEREAFEEHFFDCPECALDLRAGAAFVDEAVVQLPQITATLTAPSPTKTAKTKLNPIRWRFWLRPSFAVPAFALLLIVICYQNLVTYPALRMAARQPHLAFWVPLRGASRGDTHLSITASRKEGVAFPIELPQVPGTVSYSSYSLDLFEPQGKVIWTGIVAASAESEGAGQRLSLVIPGAMLTDGTYAILVSGITPQGERTVIARYVFDLRNAD